jgi:hypothetical protein
MTGGEARHQQLTYGTCGSLWPPTIVEASGGRQTFFAFDTPC